MNADFLRGPKNLTLDLMRLGGLSALIIYPFPYLWNVVAHSVVPDPAAFGTGYALVIGAVGAAIGAKDMLVAKANAQTGAGQ